MEEPATSLTSSLWASLNGWLTSTVLFVLLNLMIATIVFTSNLPNNNQQQQQHEEQEQEKDHNQKYNSHHERNQPQIARSPSILHRLKSFNFYPHKSQHESSPETTHYHPQPLELAATQYVFNPPLEYQHFDFDSPNPVHDLNRIDETQLPGSDLEPARNNEMRGDTGFDFDPTRPGLRGETGFGSGFEPEQEQEQEQEHGDELQSLDEVYSRLKTGRHDRTKSDGNIRPKPAAKMKKSASLKVGFAHLEEEEMVEARRPATVKEKRTAAAAAVRAVERDDDVEVDSRADDFINKFKNDLKLQRIESIMRTKGTANRGAGK